MGTNSRAKAGCACSMCGMGIVCVFLVISLGVGGGGEGGCLGLLYLHSICSFPLFLVFFLPLSG